MTTKHTLAALMILILPTVGCGGLEPGDEAFEREVSGEGKADETSQATMAAFAGTYGQVDLEAKAIENSTLFVSVQGQTIHAYAVVSGNSRTVMHAVVGGEPEVEKYTVSSQGFLGPASLERRKIVTTVTMVGRTIERKVEMYGWDVSYKVWEDWTLYGVVTDKLILIDGDNVAWDHFESQYDDRPARYRYRRNSSN